MKILKLRNLLNELFILDKTRLAELSIKGKTPKKDLFIHHETELSQSTSTKLDVKDVLAYLKEGYSPILIDSCSCCNYHVVIEENLTLIQHFEKVFLIPLSKAVELVNQLNTDDSETAIEFLDYDDDVCSMGHYQTEGYWDMYKRMHFVINHESRILFAYVDEHPKKKEGGVFNGK